MLKPHLASSVQEGGKAPGGWRLGRLKNASLSTAAPVPVADKQQLRELCNMPGDLRASQASAATWDQKRKSNLYFICDAQRREFD